MIEKGQYIYINKPESNRHQNMHFHNNVKSKPEQCFDEIRDLTYR